MYQISNADHRALPEAWNNAPTPLKTRVIHRLQGCHAESPFYPHFWQEMPEYDRRRVIAHLRAVGSLSGTNATAKISHEQIEALKASVGTGKYSLYSAPNRGNRILPSIYGKLTDKWLKATGVFVDIESMNYGHVENCLKLLKESNGNVVAKSTDLLGRMVNHFRHQPHIVDLLEQACLEIQTVDVDDMYPIYGPLADKAAEQPKMSPSDWDELDLREPSLDGKDW